MRLSSGIGQARSDAAVVGRDPGGRGVDRVDGHTHPLADLVDRPLPHHRWQLEAPRRREVDRDAEESRHRADHLGNVVRVSMAAAGRSGRSPSPIVTSARMTGRPAREAAGCGAVLRDGQRARGPLRCGLKHCGHGRPAIPRSRDGGPELSNDEGTRSAARDLPSTKRVDHDHRRPST